MKQTKGAWTISMYIKRKHCNVSSRTDTWAFQSLQDLMAWLDDVEDAEKYSYRIEYLENPNDQ